MQSITLRFILTIFVLTGFVILGTLKVQIPGEQAKPVQKKLAAKSFNSKRPNKMAVTILATHASIVRSPDNWDVDGTTVRSTCAGAYLKFNFTGTSLAVNIDISVLDEWLSASPTYWPWIGWVIDNKAPQEHQLTDADTGPITLATGLASGSHTVFFYYKYRVGGDAWNIPVESVRVESFELANGASVSAPSVAIAIMPKTMLFFGNSILQSRMDSGGFHGDALETHVPHIARAFRSEYGVIAYGAQGYNQNGNFNVPHFEDAWPYHSLNRPRLEGGLFPSDPDYIVIQHALNLTGDAGRTMVEQTVAALRVAAPNAIIFHLASGAGFQEILDADYPDSNCLAFRYNADDAYGFDGGGQPTLYTTDGIHPNVLGYLRLGPLTVQKMMNARPFDEIRFRLGAAVLTSYEMQAGSSHTLTAEALLDDEVIGESADFSVGATLMPITDDPATIRIVRGDSYLDDEISFSSTTWRDLTGATVTCTFQREGSSVNALQVTCTVEDAGEDTQTIIVPLTSANTLLFNEGVYKFGVVAVWSSPAGRKTLRTGEAVVTEDYTD